MFTAPTVFVVTTPRQVAEQEGNNITLPCNATSDKSTTVAYSWMHNSEYVNIDQRVYTKDGNLVITFLRPTDAGRYTCVVNTKVTNSLDALPRELHSNVSILSVSGTSPCNCSNCIILSYKQIIFVLLICIVQNSTSAFEIL